MTKQEKLQHKAVLLTIIGNMLDSDADTLREEFPYIMQEDDDIEDDIVVSFTKDANDEGLAQARDFYNKHMSQWESDAANKMVEVATSLSQTLNADVEFLEGAAVEYDYRRGLLFKSKALMRNTDEGLAVVLPHSPEEEKYFIKLGYRTIEDLMRRQTMNSDRLVHYHGVLLRASDVSSNEVSLEEIRAARVAEEAPAEVAPTPSRRIRAAAATERQQD